MDVPLWVWAAFVAFILAMLALDLFVLHREAHAVTTREAALQSAMWIALGVGFMFVIWAWHGGTEAGEYIAGYLLEKALSVDNIFVFILIFSYFSVPKEVQHRVLYWGVLGALVFRAIFIVLGAALLDRFHFMFYVFGAFLIYTGVRMARHGEVELHPDKNFVLRMARRLYPMTLGYHGQRFFVIENAKRMATPLLAVLIVVETTDIIFAIDSIPAIFGVTDKPFIVFTSNAFAILGLRALYFLLANMISRFKYLQVGLAAVLVFIGIKMVLEALPHDFPLHYAVPIWASLGFIVLALTTSVVVSLRVAKEADPLPPPGFQDPDVPSEPPPPPAPPAPPSA